MIECWAKAAGNCSNKMSREHFLTRNFTGEDNRCRITGLSWPKGDKNIPTKALYSTKLLCTYHNEELGRGVDKIGGDVAEVFKEAFERMIAREEGKQLEAKYVPFDGRQFEKWVVKTVINSVLMLSFGQQEVKWFGSNDIHSPPIELLNFLFKDISLPGPAGMWIFGKLGEGLTLTHQWAIDVGDNPPMIIQKVDFSFCGFPGTLVLDPSRAPIEGAAQYVTLRFEDLRLELDFRPKISAL